MFDCHLAPVSSQEIMRFQFTHMMSGIYQHFLLHFQVQLIIIYSTNSFESKAKYWTGETREVICIPFAYPPPPHVFQTVCFLLRNNHQLQFKGNVLNKQNTGS